MGLKEQLPKIFFAGALALSPAVHSQEPQVPSSGTRRPLCGDFEQSIGYDLRVARLAEQAMNNERSPVQFSEKIKTCPAPVLRGTVLMSRLFHGMIFKEDPSRNVIPYLEESVRLAGQPRGQ